MLITSIGSEYWPRTAQGRVLCFLISLYGFAVFGYVTATLTSFFIGRDAENQHGEIAGAESVNELRHEIAALRAEVKVLLSRTLPGE
jgi:voltage-gated potassium channel